MFSDDTTDTGVLDMTLQTAQKKLKDFQTSSNWNYILFGTAILTLIVAARNITVYLGEIKKLRSATGT
jgi:hypothetical protein